MNDLAIFVDSYDRNSDLWDNVFRIMDYFWPDCCFKKYLVTNEKKYSKYDVESIAVGQETDWLYCTLEALKRLREKYVFFMFEDYFFSKKVSNTQFFSIIETMEMGETFFYRLSPINGLDQSKDAVPISKEFPYAINLQPAVWNRQILVDWLERMKKEGVSTPWQFEYYFINLASNNSLLAEGKYIKGVLYDTRDIMGYKNAIIQGKWVRRIVKEYENNPNIRINLGNREYMPIKAEIWNSVKQFGHKTISYRNREKIKRLLKKVNVKFMR